MLFVKKIISYLYPVTVAKINSRITPGLEVRIENGKHVLNAQHSNYSFGTLHRVMLQSISAITIANNAHVLILGMGGGSAISILHNLNKHFKIDAIEIDKAVIKTASNFFGVSANKNLHIIEADAFLFVESCNKIYNLIIIDLFIDDEVPDAVFTKEFLFNCKKILADGGTIILNASIPNKPFVKANDELITEVFDNVISKIVNGNLVYFLEN
jgi:spermidine synthase